MPKYSAKQLAMIARKSPGYNPVLLLEDGVTEWGEATNIRFAKRNGRNYFSLVEMTVNNREALFDSETLLAVKD